ncbi:hypothetical protein I4F81_011726 [Pyropia yezoensis]|uniref:Uncharacterized protein n=1 Tax=Pyropia yezoensis TaxID=2788 RepID=A0ACC3CHM4_PYRYE|nr:hypothetical protein I4F81_011726 [Neopyropia yezoensis]
MGLGLGMGMGMNRPLSGPTGGSVGGPGPGSTGGGAGSSAAAGGDAPHRIDGSLIARIRGISGVDDPPPPPPSHPHGLGPPGGGFETDWMALMPPALHPLPEEKSSHPCSRCGLPFGRRDNLQKHMRMVHLGERPYGCDTCGYRFQKKDHRDKHVRTVHEKLKPYLCPRCDSAFGQKSDRTKHVRTVHDKIRPYSCPTCGRVFSHKGNLVRHILVVHEKQRHFRCALCAAEFGEKRVPSWFKVESEYPPVVGQPLQDATSLLSAPSADFSGSGPIPASAVSGPAGISISGDGPYVMGRPQPLTYN